MMAVMKLSTQQGQAAAFGKAEARGCQRRTTVERLNH